MPAREISESAGGISRGRRIGFNRGVRRTLAVVAAALCLSVLSACSTTGERFNALALSRIVPGQTTLAQASTLLGTPPVDTYDQGNGTVLARWAYSGTLVADAIYARQELWLEFGPDGRFERVVRKINVLANPAPVPTATQGDAPSGSTPAPSSPDGRVDGPVIVYPISPR